MNSVHFDKIKSAIIIIIIQCNHILLLFSCKCSYFTSSIYSSILNAM